MRTLARAGFIFLSSASLLLFGLAVPGQAYDFNSQNAYQQSASYTATPVQTSSPPFGTTAPQSQGTPVLATGNATALQNAKAGYKQTLSPSGAPGTGPGVVLAQGDGIPFTGPIPPDPTIGAGPTNLVLEVNGAWAAYSKASTPQQLFSDSLADLYAPLGISGLTVYDPWTTFDQGSGRFLLGALASDYTGTGLIVLAVSNSSDATGTWCLYSIDVNAQRTGVRVFADYPKVGVDADGVYLTGNDVPFNANVIIGASIFVLPKPALLNCTAANVHRFSEVLNIDGSLGYTVQPSVTFGASGGAEYLISAQVPFTTYPKGTLLTLWQITGSRNDPTLARNQVVTPETYDAPPDAEQKGTSHRLYTLDGRLMNAAYSGGIVWVDQTSVNSVTCTTDCRDEVRIYGVNTSTGTVDAYQKYTQAGFYFFNPSLMINPTSGNVTLTLSGSSSNEYPDVFIAQKLVAGWSSAQLLKAGEQNVGGAPDPPPIEQLNPTPRRWGDYGGSSVDPSGGGIWIYNEYIKTGTVWATWLAEVAG